MAKCKVCGAPHRSCGPRTTVIPVDQRLTRKEHTVGQLKIYEVRVGRRGEHVTTMQLSEDEAKRLGAKPVEKAAPAKSRKPANKSRTAANKSRTPSKPAAAPAPAKPAETAPAGGDNE